MATSGGGGGGGGGGITSQSSSLSAEGAGSSVSKQAFSYSSSVATSSTFSTSSSQSSSALIKTPIFTKPISFGSRSSQVKTLQEKLSADKSIYPEGLITGYYGSLTQAAVKRFQKKHNLETTGLINSATQAKLNEIYGQIISTSSGQTTLSTSSKQTNYSSLTEAQRQELIKQLQETLKQLLQQLLELLKKQAGLPSGQAR